MSAEHRTGAKFWPAYVINMDADTTRLANCAAILEARGIGWERVPGVDGRAMTPAAIARVYDAAENARRGRHPLIAPEIGCYLSHIAAWTRIAEGAAAGGVVFEDDFAADEDLAEVLGALPDRSAGYDMVKLFAFDAAPKAVARASLANGHDLIEPYRVPTCLIGYTLTRSAAARLVARATPFFRPVDEDQKFLWETGLRVGLVTPPPVRIGDQASITGTIGAARRVGGRTGLRQAVHSALYQIRYRLALARHRRRA